MATVAPEGWLQKCGHVAAFVQALATAAAFGVGAWWFLEQRQTYPRATLQQAVDVIRVDRNLIAVEVQARVENTGKKQIQLTHATIKLQEIWPKAYGYADLAKEDDATYWTASRPIETPDPRQFNEGELRWPLLRQFDGAIDHRVEPGETDVLMFTFLMPCTRGIGSEARRLRLVRAASDIMRPEIGEERGFAWKARTFVDVSAACSKKGLS